MKIERILMPTDFSNCANAALTHAVVLARQFEAELHFLHVAVLHQDDPNRPGEAFPGFEEIHRRWHDVAAAHMKQLIAEQPTRELTVFQAQSRALAPAPAIFEYADRENIDLIVLGTHGRRGLRRLLLGSVAEEVVRSAPCPVLTVRDEEAARRFHDVHRIVVPFDFSSASRRGLDAARELAAIYGAAIDLVHVIEPPMQAQLAEPLAAYAIDFDHGTLARQMATEMSKLIEELDDPKVPVNIRILDGPVAPTITHYADDSKADLIVIASHGASGLEHFLLGSVAEKVVRSADCPVLTLRRPAAA